MIADPLAPLDQLVTTRDGTLAVPETWQQGRGAFGGFVTAAMVRALEASAPDRALRSLTAELCGPLLPGDATVQLDTLRAGNAVTTAAVRIVQHGEVTAHGVGVLGRTRTTDRDRVVLTPPTLRPWREVTPAPIGPPMGPSFADHFEFRVTGALPFSGTATTIEGWVRPRRPGPTRDAAFLAACIDTYWPTLFALERTPRPMATIAFTFQPFPRFDGLDPEAPLAYRAQLVASADGYGVENRELWGEDGRLLALNQQTMVIIK